MSNNNLIDTNPQTNPEQSVEVDPTEQFDINRKARQEMLSRIDDILGRAARGSTLSQTDLLTGFAALQQYGKMTDEMVTGLLRDLFRVVKAVAQSEVGLFALRTNVKTIVRVLEKQELITVDMMREVHDKEILPAELKGMEFEESAEQVVRNADLVAAAGTKK